jgi:hypothetical protein
MLLAHHTASLTRFPLMVRYFTRKSTPAWMHKHHSQSRRCCVSTGVPPGDQPSLVQVLTNG